MKPDTHSGNRGLDLEEPLLFELGRDGRTGVDLPEPPKVASRLGGLERGDTIGLPGVSEPEVVRHFVRISRNNYSIDANLYPLGSCTMKHNPRLNEKMARLPGFGDVHPLQPESTVQGALELIHTLGTWLKKITGLPAIAMPPAAGAHGELCGMMAIRAAHDAKGDKNRHRVLIPESAHGTNPATAAQCGFEVDPVPGNERGRIDIAAVKAKLGPDVAGIMLTNPNTLGLFENDVIEVANAIHSVGGYFYADGANFNAIVGKARPGDMGVDAIHINLHKTFSTPHGGGGPGSGPVAFSAALAPYAPLPMVVEQAGGRFHLVEHRGNKGEPGEHSFGRLRTFNGQMGMFVRALSYMMSHGSDGLRQVAEDAVLSANYIMASLAGDMTSPFEGPCMHEALFDDRFLEGTGVTTLDFAKAMIDEGYHPMTVYFPLVVHGAMLTEPTETESKQSIDRFIGVLRHLARKAKSGDAEFFKNSPKYSPRRRVDETGAARNPVLRWQPAAPRAQAAE